MILHSGIHHHKATSTEGTHVEIVLTFSTSLVNLIVPAHIFLLILSNTDAKEADNFFHAGALISAFQVVFLSFLAIYRFYKNKILHLKYRKILRLFERN
jgi:uncharacterized membrane protein YfcA